ncbi:unnamed protein product [Cylindrotheca closterium]|uniref:Uncharacterized protein n=1 Tax=Cylindrotheca closterium TaxID=2856 RepID=A0AAD2FYN2_9STRA|nr:unnamed protein product [Cylindrotheca closterium]
MGSEAFRYCASLQEVNIEEGNLTEIGDWAFDDCVKLHTIQIPSTVERVQKYVFSSCNSLRVMQFQNGPKYLSENAFYSCKNLQSVALPESVEEIDLCAFDDCPKLVSVELTRGSRSVTIHHQVFAECTSLVNICLPSESRLALTNSNKVSLNSFTGCSALHNQYGSTNIPLALQQRFDNFPIHKKCYHASGTTTGELAWEIESSMRASQESNTNFDFLVDPFGMTPFHVLLSAAICKLDLLEVLLDAYPSNVLGWIDVNGKTAVEYLIQRSFRQSERLPNNASNGSSSMVGVFSIKLEHIGSVGIGHVE